MKRMNLLYLSLFSAIAILLASCGSGRAYYAPPPPRYHTSLSLIIEPSPGFRMDRYYDGRYYYRSPEGYTYWRGEDNRFYLDRAHLRNVHYDSYQYNEWRNHGRYHRHY